MATGYQELSRAISQIQMTTTGRLSFGDLTRQLLFITMIAYVILFFCFALIVAASGTSGTNGFSALTILLIIAMFIGAFTLMVIYIVLGARRCHDCGLPGFYQLIFLVPYAGPMLHMCLLASDPVPMGEGYGEANSKQPRLQCTKLKEAIRSLKPTTRGRLSFEQFSRAEVCLYCVSFVAMFVLMIFGYIATLFMAIIMAGANQMSESSILFTIAPISILLFILLAALMVIQFSLMIRRLHDTNRSGKNLLWCLLPIIGFFIPMVQCLADSDFQNQYDA